MNNGNSKPGDLRNTRETKSPDAIIARIMEKEAELGTAPEPVTRPHWKLAFLAALLPVFAALLVWNGVRMGSNPPVFTKVEQEQGTRFSLYVTSQGLEGILDSAGTLPVSLEAVELDDETLTYKRLTDSTYTLSATAGSTRFVYTRGDDLEQFASAFEGFAGGAGR